MTSLFSIKNLNGPVKEKKKAFFFSYFPMSLGVQAFVFFSELTSCHSFLGSFTGQPHRPVYFLPLPRRLSQGLCTCCYLFPDYSFPVSTRICPPFLQGLVRIAPSEKTSLPSPTSPQLSLSPFPALVFPIAFVTI